MRLSKKTVLDLVYGTDASRRFTQDSPVLPDVWVAFADHPGDRIDLLLNPYQACDQGGTTPVQLAAVLQRRLRRDGRGGAGAGSAEAIAVAGEERWQATSAAFNQSTVVVLLTLEEVARIALPLSPWWHQRICPPPGPSGRDKVGLLRLLGSEAGCSRLGNALQVEARRTRMRSEVQSSSVRTARHLGKPPEMPEAPDIPVDVLWLARLLGTMLLAGERPEPGSSETEKAGPRLPWPPIGLKPAEVTPEAYEDHVRKYHGEIVEKLIGTFEGLEVDLPDGAKLYSVSLNRTAAAKVICSRKTVKADAAQNVFRISCGNLAWAVIDSGIDATHPAFRLAGPDGKPLPQPFEDGKNNTRVVARFDFRYIRQMLSSNPADRQAVPANLQGMAGGENLAQSVQRGLNSGRDIDWDSLYSSLQMPYNADYSRQPLHEHGTHVAGILAGDWRNDPVCPLGCDVTGICPDLRLYDLRVLDERGEGDEFSIMAALQFVRHLNAHKGLMVIHGVNLSLSIRHDVENYACGCTPVCRECERLVGAGIVVVAAAGNEGQRVNPDGTHAGYSPISICDPGNAEGVITVGATHRNEPHSYGVSYFSSRGPTGDGRMKPDLVAPGEKIQAPVPVCDARSMDGTSMAAPHVSGAAALLMGRHAELIGKPGRIKKILSETATDLGRERYFQGAGMLDILRALQSV